MSNDDDQGQNGKNHFGAKIRSALMMEYLSHSTRNALFRFFLFNNLLRCQHSDQLKHFPTAVDVSKSDFAIFQKSIRSIKNHFDFETVFIKFYNLRFYNSQPGECLDFRRVFCLHLLIA